MSDNPIDNPNTDPAVGPAQPAISLSAAPMSNSAAEFEPPESAPSALKIKVRDPRLDQWKQALRERFEEWLEGVDEIPVDDSDDSDADAPDLYEFYAALAALGTENRKANRRTAEAFSQWGELLQRFDGDLTRLREVLARQTSQHNPDQLPRRYCLVLVELFDRFQRIAAAFGRPPRKPWWQSDAVLRQAWESQRQAFAILLAHFDQLLQKEGIVRLTVLDRGFDPTLMTAVATELDPSKPPNTVIEEIASGYTLRGELLRPAQVKITLNPAKL